MTTATTAPITTSVGHLADDLEAFKTTSYTVNQASDGTFTLTFASADAAVAAIEKAKAAAFSRYVRDGGNPRNKRSFGTSFAAAKQAVLKVGAAK